MSGSSLDGLDIVFTELTEIAGRWSYEILAAETVPYSVTWRSRLREATSLPVKNYLEFHTEYGRWMGGQVNHFIEKNQLQHKVSFIASHGHTVHHNPAAQTSVQLGMVQVWPLLSGCRCLAT